MPPLPTGAVTFLLTDIEGSTQLWEHDPAAMRTALGRLDALAANTIEQHGGHVVNSQGEGDSHFAVFARASDALTAAASLQQALAVEPWSTPTPLRLRMALHTGEADLREADYYGTVVNRCARLREVTHGGPILVSLTTQDLKAEAGKRARRWVAERCHSWMNRFRRILVRWKKSPRAIFPSSTSPVP